jgi:hypothetical protein
MHAEIGFEGVDLALGRERSHGILKVVSDFGCICPAVWVVDDIVEALLSCLHEEDKRAARLLHWERLQFLLADKLKYRH